MVVLAVTSRKGGVGKTTVSLNLAYALANRGRSTLLVDADPQGSIGLSLRGDVAEAPGLADCFRGDCEIDQALIQTRCRELEILPAGRPTTEQAWEWGAAKGAGPDLRSVLESIGPRYDAVVVDTPGGGFAGSMQTIAAADRLLLLIQAEPLAVRSVPRFLELVHELHREGRGPMLSGVLLTMVQTRRSESLGVVQEVLRLLPPSLTLEAFVPRDAAFLTASARGVPVALTSRTPPPVSVVFDQIAAEVEARLGLVPAEEEDVDEAISLLD